MPLPAAMTSTSEIWPTISKCITHLQLISCTTHTEEAALADLNEGRAVVADFHFRLVARGALAVDADAALFEEAARLGHRGREAGLDEQARELPDLRGDGALLYLVGHLLALEDAVELVFGGRGRVGRVEVGDDALGERDLEVARVDLARGGAFAHLFDVGEREVREQLVVTPHEVVTDGHDLAEHLLRRLVDADVVAE